MIPLPRHRPFLGDVEVDQPHVFVPGLMGAGVLVSFALLVADLLQRVRGRRSARRERDLVAWQITRDVVRSVHREDALDPRVGLRSRRTYWYAAAVFVGLGLYGLAGSSWNFVNPVDDGWVEDIAWVWAVSVVVVAGLLCIGVVLAVIAWRYPDVPAWARRFLARTPIGVSPDPSALRRRAR